VHKSWRLVHLVFWSWYFLESYSASLYWLKESVLRILVVGFSPPRGFPRIIFVFYCIFLCLYFSDPTTISIGLSNCNCVTRKFKILTIFYLGFLMVVLHLVSLVCFVYFLVFSVGLVDCFEGPSSTCLLVFYTFFGITGTFHSFSQSFMAQCNSSPVTQYLNCNHALLGLLLAWIHMLCMEDLKFVIP
jgi:hypothetical protein